jgi:hypothetical protein
LSSKRQYSAQKTLLSPVGLCFLNSKQKFAALCNCVLLIIRSNIGEFFGNFLAGEKYTKQRKLGSWQMCSNHQQGENAIVFLI